MPVMPVSLDQLKVTIEPDTSRVDVKTFEFVPAQYNSAPISSELEVLIRFYPIKEIDATINTLPTGWVKSTVTIIDLVSTVPGKGYELTYAGYPVWSIPVRGGNDGGWEDQTASKYPPLAGAASLAVSVSPPASSPSAH